MKNILSIFMALALLAAIPAQAQGQKPKKKAPAKTSAIPVATVRGAANVQELGRYVYDAIQNNNFATIEQYFATATDLNNTEKRTPDEDLQLVLEDHSPEELMATFRTDFDNLQNNTIEQRINLRDLKLMEVQAGAPLKANRVMPVHLLLSDANNQTVTLVFEAIKINGRYFLFQHLGVKES